MGGGGGGCRTITSLLRTIRTVQNYTFLNVYRTGTCALTDTCLCIQSTCKLQMFDDAVLSVVNWFMYQTLFSLLRTHKYTHEFNT